MDNEGMTEDESLARYEALERAIALLRAEQAALPRCGEDDGGHGACVEHFGHRGDHYANSWSWPNYGKYGNRTSQWKDRGRKK